MEMFTTNADDSSSFSCIVFGAKFGRIEKFGDRKLDLERQWAPRNRYVPRFASIVFLPLETGTNGHSS
jgi:hypothetical protein